jgi:hypothetical protein
MRALIGEAPARGNRFFAPARGDAPRGVRKPRREGRRRPRIFRLPGAKIFWDRDQLSHFNYLIFIIKSLFLMGRN